MFGIILAAISSAFEETSESIGKDRMRNRAASFYTVGFLSYVFGTGFILLEGLFRGHLMFSSASLPFFIPRVVLEIVQAHVTVRAIMLADRGDFGFLKTLTVPILFAVDLALGYHIAPPQMVGMALILGAVIALLSIEGGHIRGFWYLAVGTVNAAATISLYKFDISHFNSVEAEQSIVCLVLLVYFFVLARRSAGENPLWHLRERVFLTQSISSGLSTAISSFAYVFAPASVITAALRSSAVLFALVSGKIYFRERHTVARALLFMLVAAGLALLIVH